MEPAILCEDALCPLRVLVVAEHDIVSLCNYFTLTSFRIHIMQFQPHTPDRVTNRADGPASSHCIAQQRRSLRESVAYCIREFCLEQECLHLAVHLCSSDSEECDVPSEYCAELHSDDSAHEFIHMCVHP